MLLSSETPPTKMLILIRQWLINVIGHAHFNQNRCGQFDPLHSRGASYAPVVYVLLFCFVFVFVFAFASVGC